MSNLRPLHVAKCILSLNESAVSDALKMLKRRKPSTLMQIARKVYQSSMNFPFDQEKTYVFLYRFIILYEHLLRNHGDRPYVESMLGTEANKARVRLSELQELLTMRYQEKTPSEVKPKDEKVESVAEVPHSKIFEPFITCQDLYGIISNNEYSILLLDARSQQDYLDSHIKHSNCINIPENIIEAGLSAHKLGTRLPNECFEVWEKRDKFDLIVLLDWRTSKTNFSASKLDKLKTAIVSWDADRLYKQEPLVLDYGFMEWLETYPMLCTNARTLFKKSNAELDDLLNLEDIDYPFEHDIPTPTNKPEPTKPVVESPVPTFKHKRIPPNFEQDDAPLLESRNLALEILTLERKLRKVRETLKVETDTGNIQKLEVEESNLRKLINELMIKDTQIGISLEKQDISSKETVDIDEITKAISEHHKNLLAAARQAKKPTFATVTPKIPIVDRSTKPDDSVIALPFSFTGLDANKGTTGLHNINNTCYMNTVLQCLRQLPPIFMLYCNNDSYKNTFIPKPRLALEFSNTVKSLWRSSYISFNPREFYAKFVSLHRTYGQGNHEDCFEFFVGLLNDLSDDCSKNIDNKLSWTESQMAWYKQHCGKTSFYIRNFYHQMKCESTCEKCGGPFNVKYEVDNVIYLHIPNTSCFSLVKSLNQYIQQTDVIPCKKCGGSRVIKRSVNIFPTILVIGLKRHLKKAGEFVKLESVCEFPSKNLMFSGVKYNLRTIALHSGSCDSGHYTAIGLNCVDNKWYEYNDDRTYPANIDSEQIQRRAYGFFYYIDEHSYRSISNVSDKVLTANE